MDGLLWLPLTLGPLLFFQRRLQRETQAIFLLLTRRPEVTIILFSLLFFPGVLLHEGSHYLVARLLGVRTGRLSLLPRPMKDGRLQMGYVETAQVGIVRDALIGAAPLVFGGLFVAYAGIWGLNLTAMWAPLVQGDMAALMDVIVAFPNQSDFWVWLYLTLAVSSTMLPSASDRRAWLPLSLVILSVALLAFLLGAGSWMQASLAPFMNNALRAVALVFGISLIVHILLYPPLWGIRHLLSKITGLKVV
ncbi:MAG: hypothetical protein JXB38_14830 [Anaerolineales bacterium]|nr:hypothetical protein [Anaerolineales bacterium]